MNTSKRGIEEKGDNREKRNKDRMKRSGKKKSIGKTTQQGARMQKRCQHLLEGEN